MVSKEVTVLIPPTWVQMEVLHRDLKRAGSFRRGQIIVN